MSEELPADGPRHPRRLSCVLLADMTGFSRLMGEHEDRAMAAIARMRDVFGAVVPRHRGTLEVQVGDCFVALFDSAVDAVEAAITIQAELSADDPVRIRIGIHLGEVVRDGSEVFGDSINIAARLQTVASPGGIALSEDVYRAVRSRVAVTFSDLGAHQLKNIRGKIRIYAIAPAGIVAIAARSTPPVSRLALYAGVGIATVVLLGVVAYEVIGRWPSRSTTPAFSPAIVPARMTSTQPEAEQPVVVGVMTMGARGAVPDWMRELTRDGLNTIFSKVPRLRVYSRQKIDFVRDKQGLSELEAAEKLGIAKMISGALAHEHGRITLELQVVDIASGMLDASEQVSGDPSHLIELQNELAANVLQALKVTLSPEQRTLIFAQRTNDTLDAYRMLADTLGGTDSNRAPGPPGTSRREPQSWWLPGASVAWAEAGNGDEEAIRAVVIEWAAALQAKNLDRVAAVTLDMSDDQREALGRYFVNADQLSIGIADIDVLVAGDEALVTFTRKDSFLDKRSNRMMQLEVRLSSELAHKDGRWKMRSVKKG